MKKYNLSGIMTRAWELKKTNTENIFSVCLKMAWDEAKGLTTTESKKELLINKLEEKIAFCNKAYLFKYTLAVKDWTKYGKDRTYFAVYETSNVTKHYAKIDFGYFDNISGEYIKGRCDIEDEYDCCGRRIHN